MKSLKRSCAAANSLTSGVKILSSVEVSYSRTRIKETRIKETFGYKKRFHSFTFMQDKLSTLIGQLMKETVDKRNSFLTALCVSLIRV